MSAALDRIVPEDRKGTLYRHSAEGLDDMPAHVKAALVGVSVSVPIKDGKLHLGTWQVRILEGTVPETCRVLRGIRANLCIM